MDSDKRSVEEELNSRSRSPLMDVSGLVTQQQGEKRSPDRRENTTGILRLDFSKPRRSSGSSVEFRSPPDRRGTNDFNTTFEPPSPQPSVLSVTFAPEERSVYSDSSVRMNVFPAGSPPSNTMEKVHFSREPVGTDVEDEDEEDYSASVCAILQRRATTRRQSRRRNRRPSSPFSPDVDSGHSGIRRRSSVFTTSSGDTAISMEEGVTQEQIYENLRLHKEVLSSVKQQPWGMRRKLRLVQQAKAYVKRHEGELQERLAQSKTTRDIVASFNIILIKRWQYMKRELANLVNLLIPWELRIKEIESHFGSVVASYFTFLRWLFWVNLVITVLLVAFVVIPEMLIADPKRAGERKVMLPEEEAKATNLITLWDFEGVLKYSPIFYGYYTNGDGARNGYHLPFAYFMTGLAVYIYSFVATLKRMAKNSRMSKLSEKDDECIFTWKLFTGWDYMIGNAETAHNRTASIILGFKEALLEEAEKKRVARNWKIIGLRVLVNFTVLALLAASAYAVVEVVKRSTERAREASWWRQNEITLVLTMITFVYPIFFEVLGFFECFHPRKQLRIQLARIMVLNLLNLYTLIFALFRKISLMTKDLQNLKVNATTASAITDISETSMLWTIGSSISLTSASLPSVFESSAITTPSPVDITSSIVMILSALSQAPHLAGNISTLLQTMTTDNSKEIDSIMPTLLSLLNATEFTTAVSGFSTLFNEDNSSLLTKTSGLSTDSLPFSESTTEFKDYFTNFTIEEFLENNLAVSSELVNFSLTYTDDKDNIFNSSGEVVAKLNVTNRFGVINNSNIQSSENYLELGSKDISTNESIDYLSDNLMDNLNNTEATSNSDFNTVPNLKFDEENTSSTLTTVTENELLRSALFTTLTTLAAQNRDLSWSTEYFDQVSKIVQKITTDFQVKSTEASKCYSESCSTEKDDSSSLAVDAVNREHLSPTLSAESTTILGNGYSSTAIPSISMDMKTRRELRRLCWETMFGQELVKLTVMDLVVTVSSTLIVDFIRALFVRVMNNCWCWDLEKQFPQYGDFKIAENILHLVNNQGMVWMGMFFSPGLPLLNLIKLVILMYLRSWAVLTCNVPHEVVFRASRSNNFYFALLLTMLFLCVLPVGYAIVWVEPSWHCGPFSGYEHIYHIFTKSLQKALPKSLHRALDYIASPGTVIPLLVLLVLVIYYLLSLTSSLREANNDLKIQLRRERTEERRKMFQLVHRRRRGGSGVDGSDTPYSRWRKILPVMPSKPLPGASAKNGDNSVDKENTIPVGNGNVKIEASHNELLTRIIKRTLRKSSATSDEESMPIVDGDGTDIELHDSLPEDRPKVKVKAVKMRPHSSGVIETSFDTEQDSARKITTENKGEKNSHHHHHHHHNHKRRSGEHRQKSVSSSSTNKEREDSLTSAWSDNIPEIRISKTDSSECIQQRAEPQRPTKFSSSDTIIAAEAIEPVHKSKKTVSTSDNPSHLQKDDVKHNFDEKKQIDVDSNGQKKLMQELLRESKRKKNHKDEQEFADEIELACRNTPQKQRVRKGEDNLR